MESSRPESPRGITPWVEERCVRAQVNAPDWQAAVRAAGNLLVSAGIADPHYIEAMIRTAKELGPYIVIAPGVALPHARPEQGCLRTGFAAISLDPPIPFGNPDNDPVSLVIAFAAKDHQAHISALASLARAISDPHIREQAASAEDDSTLASLLNGTFPPAST